MRKHLILLVDDDVWWRQACRRVLERRNYDCAEASSAEEAMEYLGDVQPSAVVLDFMLPGANALQLLHEMQSYGDTQQIPVILTTSLSQVVSQAKALEEYGVRMVLDKARLTPAQLATSLKVVIV